MRSPTGFHHVGQAGLELPTSGDSPALTSKVLGLQAVSLCPPGWSAVAGSQLIATPTSQSKSFDFQRKDNTVRGFYGTGEAHCSLVKGMKKVLHVWRDKNTCWTQNQGRQDP
ncbi:hypothetical protein AAY473_008356 [Plecturocebus cupreus]